jgi:hypothetical protein
VKLTNKLYDRIKHLITIYLPLIGVTYWGSWEVFDFPKVSNVNGTINGIAGVLGLVLGYSNRKYKQTRNVPDGELYVTVDPVDGETSFLLGSNKGPEVIASKKTVTFQVKHQTPLE